MDIRHYLNLFVLPMGACSSTNYSFTVKAGPVDLSWMTGHIGNIIGSQ